MLDECSGLIRIVELLIVLFNTTSAKSDSDKARSPHPLQLLEDAPEPISRNGDARMYVYGYHHIPEVGLLQLGFVKR